MSLKIWLSMYRNATGGLNKLLPLLFLLCTVSAFSQNRKDLEDKRKRLQQEIKQTSGQLQQTQRQEKATLKVYFTLQNQIQTRQARVQNLQSELNLIDQRILRTTEVLDALQSDLRQLQTDYGSMMRTAFRMRMSQSALLFLFSAKDVNQAFRRWQYLRQMERYRSKQASLIKETQRTLQEKTTHLATRKEEQTRMLDALQSEQGKLKNELVQQDALLKNLKSDERKLLSELRKQQDAQQKLNKIIESVIQQELAAQRRRDKNTPTPATPVSGNTRSAFQQAKGRLPNPLPGSTLIRSFGTQQHPRFKDVQTQSNGIDLQATNQFSVQTVSDGKVVAIKSIPGHQNTLIIQHGAYYTVYSNLAEVLVRLGADVTANQEIGRLSKNEPELHFEIWLEQSKLNPADWIARI